MSSRTAHVDTQTCARLLAYSNRNPLKSRSYTRAVNELLDRAGFPSAEAIQQDYGVVWEAGSRTPSAEPDDETGQTTARHPDAPAAVDDRKSVPLDKPTRDRLRAYCNRNPPKERSYSVALNELMDMANFPDVEGISKHYELVWEVIAHLSKRQSDREGFEPSV